MNPLVILTAVFATAYAAPGGIVAGVAGVAPVAYQAAAPVAYQAAAPAISVPAPYTTAEVRGAPVTTIHQAPATVSKQVHLGSTTYVAGHKSEIIKPPTPHLPIQVPTALKGTTSVNAPIVKTAVETHVVNEPYPVERRVQVPYDVPVVREQIREIPVPVHVRKPYAVPHPVPVQGEPIIQREVTAPIVNHQHTNVIAQPAVAAVGYAAAPAIAHAGYANAGYAHAGYAQAGYAAAPALAAGYAAAPAIGHY